MAESQWDRLTTGAMGTNLVSAGETTIGTPPNGTRAMGYHLLEYGTGFAGHILNSTVDSGNYHPIAGGKGGEIVGSMKKYQANDHSPCFFLVNGTDVRSARGYVLGLSQENPSILILRKGSLTDPLAIGGAGNLAESTVEFDVGLWHQLSLFVGIYAHGDVYLQVRMDSTPAYPPVTTETPAGMEDEYYDDSGGVLSGSVPVTAAFYAGIGMRCGGTAGAVALFDYVQIKRQTAP